jgi:hypothetical protein
MADAEKIERWHRGGLTKQAWQMHDGACRSIPPLIFARLRPLTPALFGVYQHRRYQFCTPKLHAD